MESRNYQKKDRNDYEYNYNYAQSRPRYYNGNAAYDLSLFEGRPVNYEKTRTAPAKSAAAKSSRSAKSSRRRTAPKSKVLSKTAEERRAFARWVAIGMIFACALAMLISSRMEYHELTQEVNAANRQLELLQHDYEGLRITFETKMSSSAIEEYATDVLGMQKRESSQTEWISLGGGDVFEYTSGSEGRFSDILDQVLSYMD